MFSARPLNLYNYMVLHFDMYNNNCCLKLLFKFSIIFNYHADSISTKSVNIVSDKMATCRPNLTIRYKSYF